MSVSIVNSLSSSNSGQESYQCLPCTRRSFVSTSRPIGAGFLNFSNWRIHIEESQDIPSGVLSANVHHYRHDVFYDRQSVAARCSMRILENTRY